MIDKSNALSAFESITEYWSPKVIGQVNNLLVKAAKLKGELVWHAHGDEDELFYIVRGSLQMEFEDRTIEMAEGDILTVPKGGRHNPVAADECWVLLIEPASTKHTGDEITPQTRSLEEQMSS